MSDEYEHKLEAKSEYVADTSSVSSVCFHNGGYELSFHEWQGFLCVCVH